MVIEDCNPTLGPRISLSNLKRRSLRGARSTANINERKAIYNNGDNSQLYSVTGIPPPRTPRMRRSIETIKFCQEGASPNGISRNRQPSPYRLQMSKKRSRHALRQYHSRLDLLDSCKLTVFPKVGEFEGCSDYQDGNGELSIMDDYIRPPVRRDSGEFLNDDNKPLHCTGCNIPIHVDPWFIRSTVVCPECIENKSIQSQPHIYTIVKVESQDSKSLYYVLNKSSSSAGIYGSLAKKLRWRWRIRGLTHF